MNFLVDMDGVLADFDNGFLNIWRERYPAQAFIPYEKRATFYVVDQYPHDLKELVRQTISAPGFFRSLPPVPGSLAALSELKARGHEVHICTSARSFYKNCVLEKFEWVEQTLGADWIKALVIGKDRTMLRGDVLIDDRPKYEGAYHPTWEHVIYDQPYNRDVVGKRRLSWENWKTVLFGEAL